MSGHDVGISAASEPDVETQIEHVFFFKQKVQGVEQNSMVCPIFPLLIAAKIWGSQVLNKGFIKNWGN